MGAWHELARGMGQHAREARETCEHRLTTSTTSNPLHSILLLPCLLSRTSLSSTLALPTYCPSFNTGQSSNELLDDSQVLHFR